MGFEDINILLPIETASRELVYKVYLCHYLALLGFSCYLGRKSYIEYLTRKLKGYIYLDKGYHRGGGSDNIYRTVKKNNGIIVSLDEEGGVDYSDGSTLLGRYSKALFDNSNLTCLWGLKQWDLVKKNMNKKNKVIVTGHPRFELLKPRFHYLYQDEVDKIKKRYQDFILINTNMGFGNNIRGDDFVESNYGDRFKNINKIIAFDKKKLEAYRLLVLELSKQLNKTIVLRPHPEEDYSFYLNAFKSKKNIHIIYEGSVIPWLIAADLMIHPDCTTAIESLFIGKRPISYLPKGYPIDLVTELPLKASLCFIKENDLLEYIKNTNTLSEVIDLKEYSFVEESFSYSKPTTELIINKINHLKNGFANSNTLDLSFERRTYLKFHAIISEFSNNVSSRLAKNKLKGLSLSAINDVNRKLCQIDNAFRKINITKINKELYAIY